MFVGANLPNMLELRLRDLSASSFGGADPLPSTSLSALPTVLRLLDGPEDGLDDDFAASCMRLTVESEADRDARVAAFGATRVSTGDAGLPCILEMQKEYISVGQVGSEAATCLCDDSLSRHSCNASVWR